MPKISQIDEVPCEAEVRILQKITLKLSLRLSADQESENLFQEETPTHEWLIIPDIGSEIYSYFDLDVILCSTHQLDRRFLEQQKSKPYIITHLICSVFYVNYSRYEWLRFSITDILISISM